MASTHFPCGKPKPRQKSGAHKLMGQPLDVWPVTQVRTPEQLLLHCFPAFGGAFVNRIYKILDEVIGKGIPLVMSVAGPVTVSNQHRAWLIPMIEAGWIAYLTTTDAVCYHDGHDSLQRFKERPIKRVEIEGHDQEYGEAGIIRVTDAGFREEILFEQDRFITTMLRRPEFQRKMTGTEFRNLLGQYYAAQEAKFGVAPGLLSACWQNGIPIFVGAPGDGSVFLNHVKLWALARRGHIEHKFELDVAAEVFESCAYHYWGLRKSRARRLAILILGGGVPKNFSLQPEPTLGQIFLLKGIRGYDYDTQLVGAPVTDGSLTSCKPAEAYTWGKISLEALLSRVESLQADYSTIMPLIAWALLDKRRRFQKMREEMGIKKLLARHPEARGYLALNGHHRLFERRKELVDGLLDKVTAPNQRARIATTWNFPLQKLLAA